MWSDADDEIIAGDLTDSGRWSRRHGGGTDRTP
jgi:hypothetical protein